MENKTLIVSDSTCDLSKDLLDKYNIKILPLAVTLGENTYHDGVDIDADAIYDYYHKTGILPKTSAINIGEAEIFFKPFAEEGYSIVHFSLSSDMSTSYHNVLLASENFENIYVVDCKNVSTGNGLLVLAAAEMAQKGMSAKEIFDKVSKLVPCVDASFIIDKLEFLYKGGRCSAVSALGANLLKIKPCITVVDGKMGVSKKYRGKFVDTVKEYVAERLENIDDINTHTVFVTHAGCPDDVVTAAVETVKSLAKPENLFITRAGSTISSHCGADTLGVLFLRKSPISK